MSDLLRVVSRGFWSLKEAKFAEQLTRVFPVTCSNESLFRAFHHAAVASGMAVRRLPGGDVAYADYPVSRFSCYVGSRGVVPSTRDKQIPSEGGDIRPTILAVSDETELMSRPAHGHTAFILDAQILKSCDVLAYVEISPEEDFKKFLVVGTRKKLDSRFRKQLHEQLRRLSHFWLTMYDPESKAATLVVSGGSPASETASLALAEECVESFMTDSHYKLCSEVDAFVLDVRRNVTQYLSQVIIDLVPPPSSSEAPVKSNRTSRASSFCSQSDSESKEPYRLMKRVFDKSFYFSDVIESSVTKSGNPSSAYADVVLPMCLICVQDHLFKRLARDLLDAYIKCFQQRDIKCRQSVSKAKDAQPDAVSRREAFGIPSRLRECPLPETTKAVQALHDLYGMQSITLLDAERAVKGINSAIVQDVGAFLHDDSYHVSVDEVASILLFVFTELDAPSRLVSTTAFLKDTINLCARMEGLVQLVELVHGVTRLATQEDLVAFRLEPEATSADSHDHPNVGNQI